MYNWIPFGPLSILTKVRADPGRSKVILRFFIGRCEEGAGTGRFLIGDSFPRINRNNPRFGMCALEGLRCLLTKN